MKRMVIKKTPKISWTLEMTHSNYNPQGPPIGKGVARLSSEKACSQPRWLTTFLFTSLFCFRNPTHFAHKSDVFWDWTLVHGCFLRASKISPLFEIFKVFFEFSAHGHWQRRKQWWAACDCGFIGFPTITCSDRFPVLIIYRINKSASHTSPT